MKKPSPKMRGFLKENLFHNQDVSLEATRNWPRFPLFSTPETIGRLGTSFRRNELWDRFGGQALLITG